MENYHMYNEIGRGTHSSVYKARRKRSIEYVAIKSTAKSRMDKILNEVPFLHKLDSPYVLKFLDWYESSNHIWLILEYCVGGDLLNLITQDKQLPESVVKSFGLDLVAGLQYLHANSILYCDLKPGNVLIDEFGLLKLADFGLARRIPGSGTPPARLLAPGSPHYMAPELFQQTAVHSFASDFWALGCVLYELRTGRQPFIHTTFSELARMIQTEAVQLPLSDCDMSLEFCDLLRRLLDKDPYQRITWDELLVHPFWDGLPHLANVDVPRQPIFEKRSPMSLNRDRDCENAWSANKSDADLGDACDKDSPKISIAQEQKRPPNEGEAVAVDDKIGCSSHGLSDSFRAIQDHVATSAIKNEVRAPILETHDLPNDHVEPDDGTDDDIQGGSDKLTGHRRRRQRPMMPQVVPAASRHVRGQRMQGHQVQLSGLFDRSGASGSWLRRISTLVFTAEDCAMKPIIRNADTELDDSPPSEVKLLRFAVISPEVLLSCTEETLQIHLTEVYTSLSSYHGDSSETLSCMAYLHSLSRYTRLADAIVKGSILGLLIRMLAQEVQLATSSETMLSMLCLVLGHLFQSTTVIALSSPDQLRQLVKILLRIVADFPIRVKDTKTTSKNESQSRSRALACLGELLLYLLIKKKWELPVDGMNAVFFGIEDPDIATRYYATRTLCNMLTHAAESLLPKLVRGKVVLTLIRGLLQWDTPVFDDQGDTHERRLLVALRTTIAETLAQVLRHVCTPSSSACLPSRLKRSIKLYFAKPDVLNAVWQGVESPCGSSDLVLASLNVINAFLAMELVRGREAEYAAIQSSRALLLGRIVKMPAIQNVMVMNGSIADDNGDGECLAMLQAKSLILLHVGIQLNRDFLTSFVENGGLVLVEETVGMIAELSNAGHSILASPSPGDKFSMYLTQCAFNLCKLLIELALEFGADCFRTCDGDNESNKEMNGLQVSPILFQLFRGLLRHSNCRQQLHNYFTTSDSTKYTIFVRRMAKLLALFPDRVMRIFGELETETTIACSVSEILLLLFQSAAREANGIVLVDEHELFTHLLPAAVQLVYGDKKSMNGQAADNCLKLLHVVLLDFDYDDEKDKYKLYDPFIRSILLPYLSDALKRHDAMDERIWNLSSELLFGLLSSDTSLVSEVENLDLVSTIVNMLCVPVTFTSLPSNSVQLVQILMDSADVNLDWLHESGIARGMVIGLTLAAKQKQVDESLVDLVVIFLTLLQHQFRKTRQPEVTPSPLGFNDLVACGPLLLQLCTCGDETQMNRQPEGLSPENKTKAHDMALEVVDVSSRCLVLLSRVNDVVLVF